MLDAGVRTALDDPGRLRYWVAERDGRVVAQTAITREWSDWRNGWIWWLQSVFVAVEHRGQGIFRALFSHIRREAFEARDVVGLRLDVERENEAARTGFTKPSDLGTADMTCSKTYGWNGSAGRPAKPHPTFEQPPGVAPVDRLRRPAHTRGQIHHVVGCDEQRGRRVRQDDIPDRSSQPRK